MEIAQRRFDPSIAEEEEEREEEKEKDVAADVLGDQADSRG